MKTPLLAVLLLALPAAAAVDYAKYQHPKGDFVLEYPSDWKRYFGMQTVWLEPPARESRAKVGLELHPYGKETAKAAEFAEQLMKAVGEIKKLDTRAQAKVGGFPAERLAFTETLERKGPYGQKMPGPMQEVFYVVPVAADWFYVLKLQGIGEPFKKALPEFERMAQKLVLKAPVLEEPKKKSGSKPARKPAKPAGG
ncbi:MAG: hypothetical protein HY924_10780 [Elusimicrobia bacterium]|nr:hypothetical protein [Elusimicrobiota bacterium]